MRSASIPTTPDIAKRNATMAGWFLAGHTLAEIGSRVGLTKARVGQILLSMNIAARDGGAHVKSMRRLAYREAEQEARSIRQWGHTRRELEPFPSDARRKYRTQRDAATKYGIPWRLRFVDWWRVWCDSGQFNQRGLSRHGYVLGRIDKAGAFEISNVHVVTRAQNSMETQRARRRS